MKITRIELTHFGKFQNRTFEFQEGCNLIYGQNEAGKTTIHTFLYGMFFGLEPSRGRGVKSSLYTRYLPWETPNDYSGKLWFEKDGCTYRIERCFLKEKRSLRLIDTTHGRELTPADTHLAGLLAPMTEATFRNTLSIRQMQNMPDEDFASQLENYIANLNATKSSEFNLSAAQDALNALLREKKHALHPEITKEQMELEIRKKELLSETAALNEIIAGHEKDIRAARMEAARKLEKASQEKAEQEKKAAEEIKQDKEHPQEKIPGSLPLFPAVLGYLLSVLALLVVGYILFTDQLQEALPYALGALWSCLIFSIIYGSLRTKRRHQIRKLSVREASAAPSEAPAKEPLPSESPVSPEALAAVSRQEALAREQAKAEVTLSAKKEQLYEIDAKMNLLKEQAEKSAEAETEMEAIRLSLSRLEQLSKQIHDSYGSNLMTDTSVLFARLTKGHYSSLSMDEDLHIFVNTENHLIPVEQLSRGTLDQIYFCFRIAAARLVSPKEAFPFLLDDVFAYYDEERLKAALRLLRDLDTQVILFSCHKREQVLMKECLEEAK